MSDQQQDMHPIVGAVAGARESLKGVRDVQPVFMSPDAQTEAVTSIAALEGMLAELKLRVLAASGDAADQAGARDVGAWLAHLTQADSSTARADARLAAALDRKWSRVAAGMADGTVSAEQARVIVAGLDALPDRVGVEVIAQAEAHLVELASHHRPSELRRLARHILDTVAPEIAEAEAAKRLEAEEQAARDKTRLSLRPVGDGTTRLSGIIPDETAARLKTYLEAFTSPRKHPDAVSGEEDRIPYPRKLGRAFCALIEHLNPRKLPAHGGDTTTVMVTITLESLIARLATGGIIDADLTAGDNLSAEAIRRLACNAGIIPVVLGTNSEILDLGRTRRLFSPAQRKAMALRDKTCRAEGCTVPARWCEAHHLIPWSEGGMTDIKHGILGCSHHHHLLHDPNHTHEILPNGDIRFHRRT